MAKENLYRDTLRSLEGKRLLENFRSGDLTSAVEAIRLARRTLDQNLNNHIVFAAQDLISKINHIIYTAALVRSDEEIFEKSFQILLKVLSE